MSNPIAEYQEAMQKHSDAQSKVERLVKTVSESAAILKDRRHAMFANTEGNIGFPMEIALSSNTPTINAQTFPTGNQLAAAVAAWHTTRTEVRNAYEQIPSDQRAVVVAPTRD